MIAVFWICIDARIPSSFAAMTIDYVFILSAINKELLFHLCNCKTRSEIEFSCLILVIRSTWLCKRKYILGTAKSNRDYVPVFACYSTAILVFNYVDGFCEKPAASFSFALQAPRLLDQYYCVARHVTQ